MKATILVGRAQTDAFYVYEDVEILPYDDDAMMGNDQVKLMLPTNMGDMMAFVEAKDHMDFSRVQIKQ